MAAMESSPENSPPPCLFWGLDRIGKPRTPARVSNHKSSVQIIRRLTNDIAAAQVDVLFLEARGLLVGMIGLSEHLEPRTLI